MAMDSVADTGLNVGRGAPSHEVKKDRRRKGNIIRIIHKPFLPGRGTI